jgi:hypothetical protein
MKNSTEKKHEILLGLTTTYRSNWKEKLNEIRKYSIDSIALFPTILDQEERKELYRELEKSPIKRIPHVHLRGDMGKWELDYLIEKFGTRFFNIHPENSAHPFPDGFNEYRNKIYVENVSIIPSESELDRNAGICLDMAHWEGKILDGDSGYSQEMMERLVNYPVGCCHVSAISKIAKESPFDPGLLSYDQHFMENLDELDYVGKYLKYLSKYISLELENSIAEQLEAKKYLEKIINHE